MDGLCRHSVSHIGSSSARASRPTVVWTTGTWITEVPLVGSCSLHPLGKSCEFSMACTFARFARLISRSVFFVCSASPGRKIDASGGYPSVVILSSARLSLRLAARTSAFEAPSRTEYADLLFHRQLCTKRAQVAADET